MADFNKILDRVQKLIAMAEADNNSTNPAEREATEKEQQAAREQADALMLRFAIDQAILDDSAPAYAKRLPLSTTFLMGGSSEIIGYVARLSEYVADHCRCLVRSYTAYTADGYVGTVYGYESDVRYFELLYTTLRLHMLGVLLPRVDSSKSLEDNCYALHNAGFNWLEIAGMYGWSKASYSFNDVLPADFDDREYWVNRTTREYRTNTKLGSGFKRAYFRALESRNEKATVISAGGSKTFRVSAAIGYVGRIGTRLRMIQGKRGAGTELSLSNANLEQWFRSQNPKSYAICPSCGKWTYIGTLVCDVCMKRIREMTPEEIKAMNAKPGRTRKYQPLPFNSEAYGRGTRHADTADLDGSKVSAPQRPQIG